MISMDIALLALAFSAGVAIFFSPCGVALLPSYVAYLLSKQSSGQLTKLVQAFGGFKIGLVVSAGIITVFIGLGAVVALFGNILAPYAFWFGTGTGVLLILLGIFMLAGKSLHIPQLQIKTGSAPALKTYYVFGLGYALGGIACTLGVFLFVVSAALSSGSFPAALLTFVSFTAGSVLFMVAVSTASAIARALVARWLTQYVKPIQILSALIIVAGGGYLIWFNARAFL